MSGTGFTEAERDRLQDRLEALERPGHPFAAPPPREDMARARWIDSVLVGEVQYRQYTHGGRLRHTSWRRAAGRPRAQRNHRPADTAARRRQH